MDCAVPQRLVLLAAGVLTVVSALAPTTVSAADGPRAAAPKSPRKNVVLIVADDLGLQLGCYGDKQAKTPHLDRLAAEGVRFTRSHCTTASCSASRSVLLTGLQNHATGHYGHAHGDGHFSTYESVKSLPVWLSEAGYRTCSIGKYHVAPEYVYHFDAYRNEETQGHRNTVRMARNARDWIAEEDDRPFFLYFCTSDPHRGGGPGGFANFGHDPQHYPGVTPVRYNPDDLVVPDWLPDQPEVRQELAEFYQAIARVDQGVGALLAALDETGHAKDTLVLFLSDNGPPFPGAKTTLYQPGMQLPLIVRHPDLRGKAVVNPARVNWADITPTILDYCGVEARSAPAMVPRENAGQRVTTGKQRPYEFHGRSFLSILGDARPQGWDEIYASHTFHEITMYYPMRSILSGKYKYILNLAHPLPYPFASDLFACPTWQASLQRKDSYYGKRLVSAYVQRPRHELYDLEADPDELINLAEDPQHAKALTELQAKLKAWQERTRDPWVSKYTYE